jgi:ABC-type antimicrobial peptide transport system permease subunit
MGARDMAIVIAVAVLLVVAAMAAAYPSALRASRLDPVGALRAD